MSSIKNQELVKAVTGLWLICLVSLGMLSILILSPPDGPADVKFLVWFGFILSLTISLVLSKLQLIREADDQLGTPTSYLVQSLSRYFLFREKFKALKMLVILSFGTGYLIYAWTGEGDLPAIHDQSSAFWYLAGHAAYWVVGLPLVKKLGQKMTKIGGGFSCEFKDERLSFTEMMITFGKAPPLKPILVNLSEIEEFLIFKSREEADLFFFQTLKFDHEFQKGAHEQWMKYLYENGDRPIFILKGPSDGIQNIYIRGGNIKWLLGVHTDFSDILRQAQSKWKASYRPKVARRPV